MLLLLMLIEVLLLRVDCSNCWLESPLESDLISVNLDLRHYVCWEFRIVDKQRVVALVSWGQQNLPLPSELFEISLLYYALTECLDFNGILTLVEE